MYKCLLKNMNFSLSLNTKSIVKLDLISTGNLYADGGAMFGIVPKTAWQRRYPHDENNRCLLAMRSLLVRTDCGRVILVDTGAGNKQLKNLSYYGFSGLSDLHQELLKRGVKAEEVTDVVFTHLHFDHCGYATLEDPHDRSLSLAFPKATHWVSRKQWENFMSPNPLENDSYFPENMQAVVDAGLLRLIDTATDLCDGVALRLFDGHTPGQIVPYIQGGEQTYVFAGDVVPLAAHLSLKWISAYDTFPLTSYAEKKRLLDEAVQEKQALIYCHDAYTDCSTVKKINHFYKQDQVITI